MRYYELSVKKLNFIITPEELRDVLQGLDHVTVSTGVPRGYTKSDPNDFITTYAALYRKLKSSERLTAETDYRLAFLTVGVTRHPDNCTYKPTDRLSVPDFAEPCPRLDTFCFLFWNGLLSTSFSVTQYPENICGLRLSFPSKIEYPAATEKHPAGVAERDRLSDFETFEDLSRKIKAITKPLLLEYNGRIVRTQVRVSGNAGADLGAFYFMISNNIRSRAGSL